MAHALMSNAATQTSELFGGRQKLKPSTGRRYFILAAFVLALTAALSAWVYVENSPWADVVARRLESVFGRASAKPDAALPLPPDTWALRLAVATAAGGAGFLLLVFIGMKLWHRVWTRRFTAKAREWQNARIVMRHQLLDARRTAEELQRQKTELEARWTRRGQELADSNERLQEELNKQKRAEKALTLQRQELESSKSVLELHVQARTQELQRLQRRYEMILNSAGEGICGLDLDGRATFVNPAAAKITGWQIDELISKQAQEILGRNSANGDPDTAFETAKEQVFYRRDGTPFPVELVETPISENGQVIGTVLVFKDITERKRAEDTLAGKAAELARSNAELEQFAFVASHDLQEPLRKIQAFGDRVKAKCQRTRSAETRDYLERMQKAAGRMQTLINDLLAFSRVIRSAQPFARVDLSTVTREVLVDLEVSIEKARARIETGELPVIDADAMQMRQLIQNLISNALKFQSHGSVPVIKIQARLIDRQSLAWDTAILRKPDPHADSGSRGDQLCELTVQDNGIGFEEKYAEKIFAVFQRLHGRAEYEGTGVGLAVCRRIAERHGGSVTARSQPGQGATFMVTLPVRQPAAGGPR
jgi:PAS domain S-box-containing protein